MIARLRTYWKLIQAYRNSCWVLVVSIDSVITGAEVRGGTMTLAGEVRNCQFFGGPLLPHDRPILRGKPTEEDHE